MSKKKNKKLPFDYNTKADQVIEAQQKLHRLSAERFVKPLKPTARELHAQAALEFQATVSSGYPPGFWEAFEKLRNHLPDGEALEIAISFLEDDPWFFRSGYIKEKLVRYILAQPLKKDGSERLQEVILYLVHSQYRTGFRSYCKLAKKIYSDHFRRQLEACLKEDDSGVRTRATWVLEICQGVPADQTIASRYRHQKFQKQMAEFYERFNQRRDPKAQD